MSSIMENLINNKFYSTKEEVEKKLSVFFAFNVITQDDYNNLMQLAESKYAEANTGANTTTENTTTENTTTDTTTTA